MGDLTRREVLATIGTVGAGGYVADNRETVVGGGGIALPSDSSVFTIASGERVSPDDGVYEALRMQTDAGLALSGLSGLTLAGGA